MMITPAVRHRLGIFAVISALMLSALAFYYADAPSAVGIGRHAVSADFAATSGLYPRALVTYRGVAVGEVESVELSPAGVMVRMSIDADVNVPKSATARIQSTSAIGEQYVDLVPTSASSPYLADGDVIPRAQTVEMPQITPLLENVNDLLVSIPKPEATAVLEELERGVGGAGPDLGQLIDEASTLINEANSQVAATTALLRHAEPVLKTQEELGPATNDWLSSLASFSRQLDRSDGDLRDLLDEVPRTTSVTTPVIDGIEPTLPKLLDNGVVTADLLRLYRLNLRQLFIAYPALQWKIGELFEPHADTGAAKLDLRTQINDPAPCTTGYQPVEQRRDPAITTLTDTPPRSHCALPRSSPEAVRGARNQPCANDPRRRAATPAECGLFFGRGILHPESGKSRSAVGATPASMLDMLGAPSSQRPKRSWRQLLTSGYAS